MDAYQMKMEDLIKEYQTDFSSGLNSSDVTFQNKEKFNLFELAKKIFLIMRDKITYVHIIGLICASLVMIFSLLDENYALFLIALFLIVIALNLFISLGRIVIFQPRIWRFSPFV